jgi:hypothetical protein
MPHTVRNVVKPVSFIYHLSGLDRVVIIVYRVVALPAGCNDFLAKPVSLEWLSNKIIGWGSIMALQLFADSQGDSVESVSASGSSGLL